MNYNALVLIFLWGTSLSASLGNEYAYSRACSAGLCGDWNTAQHRMSQLMVENPDNPELLYDNGVAAYQLKEYQKAYAYFKSAAKSARKPALTVCSLFNAGNAAFGLQKHDDAITQYESVLRIDPGNVPAKHNLEVVKKIQQQEKNKEQQQDGGDDQQDNQGDQKNGDQKQQQKKAGKSEKDKSKQRGDERDEERDGAESDQKGDDGHDSDSQEQQKKYNSQGDQEGDEEGDSDKRAGERKDENSEQDGDDDHGNPQDTQGKSGSQDTEADAKEQMQSGKAQQSEKDRREKENQQFAQQFAPSERWMMNALARREKSDEQAQKQMTKKEIDKKLPGNHGQNNW